MQGNNDKQRRQGNAIDNKIIHVLKRMPENEAPWRTMLALTGLFDAQLDRHLNYLMRLSIVEKRSIWIRRHESVVYRLRNSSLKKLIVEKRAEMGMKTRQITRREGWQIVRDYGTWRQVMRIDQTPDPRLQQVFDEAEKEENESS